MLFNVKVVSQADYDAYLADLAEAGQTADAAARSAAPTSTHQAGLDDDIGRSERVSAATSAATHTRRSRRSASRWASRSSGS